MQCDKVEKFLKKFCFVKGTDAKSANLPQIFQNLHSHTANTNFVACNSNPTESTPSEAEPSTECKENTESKESLESSLTESQADSESKQLTESTTPKNLNKALPNKICSAAARSFFRKIRKKVAAVPPLIFCLDKDTARHSPRLRKKSQRVASQATAKKRRFIFFGALTSGEGITPLFLLRKQVMMRS